MNIDKAFPSRYLKCGDLDGREIIVTISKVVMENVGQTKESKPVVYFRNAGKGMVLNRTNSKRIEAIVGSVDTDDWTGHRIKLYPTETEFAGEVVECVRVKSPDSKKKAEPIEKAEEPAAFRPAEDEPVAAADEDEIPF